MRTENIKAWQELIGKDRNIKGHNSDLEFVATVATGGRVKFVPAV